MGRLFAPFWRGVRLIVLVLAAVVGLCIAIMIGVTCADVAMRIFGRSLRGAYDIVQLTGAVAIACALPYTSAVKGHVAIEYFFHKLRRPGRIVVDTLSRLTMIALFGGISWQSVMYGNDMRRAGQVSMTLQMPLYWVPYVIAGSFVVTMLVTTYNMLHPGRTMIKP